MTLFLVIGDSGLVVLMNLNRMMPVHACETKTVE